MRSDGKIRLNLLESSTAIGLATRVRILIDQASSRGLDTNASKVTAVLQIVAVKFDEREDGRASE